MKKALILSGGGSRGSFQVGVWRYLQEKQWYPDMICGSSIGAINAVAIGSGMTVEQMINIWRASISGRNKIYRLQILRFILNALLSKGWTPLMDTLPLKSMIQSAIDFNKLRQSRAEIIISAVNLHTASPEFFNQNEITIDHVMASSAMPVIFEPYKIDGIPYWDGGIMANTPLLPALFRGVEQIIVVLLSPVGHMSRLPDPKRTIDAGEHLLEQSLVSSYHTALITHRMCSEGVTELAQGSAYLRKKNINRLLRNQPEHMFNDQTKHAPKIITIAPSKMLGIPSLLNFSLKQAEALLDDGYNSARNQLKDIL